jgi:hypothetical protein
MLAGEAESQYFGLALRPIRKKLVSNKHSSFLPLRQCRRRKSFMTLTLGRRGQHWPELYGIDGQAEANPENPV